ncbi:MAG: hypothetical protein ABI832_11715 [bacterium]
MRRLYLHVGVHRTGTTSIQRFLRANFDVLLQKGYLFPFGVARHNQVVSRMRDGAMDVTEFAEDLLRRVESRGDGRTSVILSDEDMSNIEDFSIFSPLKKIFDVKVVVSLRRQDLWLESWFFQNLKWQWNPSLSHLTFAEFFARRREFHWIDYAARLAHYEAVFGPGSVIAGVFEKADMPEGPIDAFLRMVGISDMAGFGPMLHSNSSMSPLMTEFIRQLPLDAMAGPDRRLFEKACGEVDAKLVKEDAKLIMPYDQRLVVQADYAAGNRLVAQKYLGRDELFHDPLPGPQDAVATMALPDKSADLMRDFVAPMVHALAAQMAEARSEEAAKAQHPLPGPGQRGPGQRRPGLKGQGPKNDRVRPRT